MRTQLAASWCGDGTVVQEKLKMEEKVEKAKLAEQAERYEDMAKVSTYMH